uniref:Secreted protein n=1 Tax=Knipowitschia caucasica TaxID=637954 RepID=A0AAV2KIG2_KNICA
MINWFQNAARYTVLLPPVALLLVPGPERSLWRVRSGLATARGAERARTGAVSVSHARRESTPPEVPFQNVMWSRYCLCGRLMGPSTSFPGIDKVSLSEFLHPSFS